ncbi:MAG: DsbA family oxidoreductase [Burkholderiaceae bacterium]
MPVQRIDIVSDVVCPWCYIGKRQLEEALQRWREARPQEPAPVVAWHPFQLSPETPIEGVDRDAYMQAKFGTADLSRMHARIEPAASAVGLKLNFDRIGRQPNTRPAHALIAACELGAPQERMVEALFRGFFVDGADLSNPDTLVELAVSAGLPRQAARGLVDDAATLDAVAQADRELRSMGISGVPFFVVDQKVGVSGAQGADALYAALERADAQAG